MIRYLTLDEVLAMHALAIARYGGSSGLIDIRLVDSAVAQPRQTFSGIDLHSSLEEKAAVLGFHLCSHHGIKDGNKRIGYLAMDAFLRLNGMKIVADVADAETIFPGIASHTVTRDELLEWVRQQIAPV